MLTFMSVFFDFSRNNINKFQKNLNKSKKLVSFTFFNGYFVNGFISNLTKDMSPINNRFCNQTHFISFINPVYKIIFFCPNPFIFKGIFNNASAKHSLNSWVFRKFGFFHKIINNVRKVYAGKRLLRFWIGLKFNGLYFDFFIFRINKFKSLFVKECRSCKYNHKLLLAIATTNYSKTLADFSIFWIWKVSMPYTISKVISGIFTKGAGGINTNHIKLLGGEL